MYRQSGINPRAAIEAAIGALKHPFSDDQVPVRGCFRVAILMLGSAIMFNVRRIQRYLCVRSAGLLAKGTQAGNVANPTAPFWTRLRTAIQALLFWHRPTQPVFSPLC
jgi:hypothetical protein